MSFTKDVSRVSEETKSAIKRKSTYYLPDRPTDSGMTPESIKGTMWKPVCDETDSVLNEVDRVAAETHDALEEVKEAITGGLDEVKSDLQPEGKTILYNTDAVSASDVTGNGDVTGKVPSAAAVREISGAKYGDVGVGTNTPAGNLSFYSEAGKPALKNIPLDSAYPKVTLSGASISLTLSANVEYYAGVVTSANIGFPNTGTLGEYCYICFKAGTGCTVTVQTDYTSDCLLAPVEGHTYEIMAKWNGSIWMLALHDMEE